MVSKKLNKTETYGHLFGSYAISECGKIIGKAIGKQGQVCRYGGDEFIAYLRNTPAQSAFEISESIRETIDQHTFELNGQAITPKISIGVAELTSDMDAPEALISRADEALYRAKEAGRNIVSS